MEDSSEDHEESDFSRNYVKDQLCNADFKYPPINTTAQIRLLRIVHQPNDTITEKIRCELEAIDVSQLDSTEYAALSYTWGEARTAADIHPIEIGEQIFWVRTNLFHFLSSASESETRIPIYIDAVCLDQQNDVEKGHQVGIMSQIYAKATKVLAWVGQPHEDQHEHFTALSTRLSSTDPIETQWDVSEMISLSYLCSRQFWRRLWVVQELLLAKDIVLVCGTWRFPWKDISRLARLPLSTDLLDNQEQVEWWDAWKFPCPKSFQQQKEYQDRLFDGWHSALRLLHHRRKWRLRQKYVPYSDAVRAHGWPLHRAVRDFRLQQCRDRRDKVYALIGLLDEESRNMITPSYESPMEDLFLQATAAGLISLRRETAAELLGTPDLEYRNRLFCDTLNDILGLPEDGREARTAAAIEFATSYFPSRTATMDSRATTLAMNPEDENELIQTQMANIIKRKLTKRNTPASRKQGGFAMLLPLFLLHIPLTFFVFIATVNYLRPRKASDWDSPLHMALIFPASIILIVVANLVLGCLEFGCYRLWCYSRSRTGRAPRIMQREGSVALSSIDDGDI